MSIFSKVGGAHPRRNKFNLSYSVKTTAEMGKLYPAGMPQMMVPGDTFKIGHEVVAQMQPLVAPVMADISIYFYDFFVPFRLLWDDWEKFITRGVTGDETPPLPKYQEYSYSSYAKHTLFDYFGFPAGVANSIPYEDRPLDFPWRAYWFIWNEYFRDENLMPEVDFKNLMKRHEVPARVCWGRDYFTSSLPFQQRGTPVAIPVVSSGFSADFPMYSDNNSVGWDIIAPVHEVQTGRVGLNMHVSPSQNPALEYNRRLANGLHINDISSADVADLRFMFQVQKFQERSARAGVRYTEFLRAHFGVSPRDERLQRPEFIGGCKTPILIQQVLQTSQTSGQSTPTGTKYGQGMTADSNYSGTYYASEYGVMISLFCIRPKAAYMQGINRQWIKDTSYDFFNPLFQSLSEQEIFEEELFASANHESNRRIFGFTGRYNELRHNQNLITGGMRDTFNYWHLGRDFYYPPSLNEDFLNCEPSKRIFAVQGETDSDFILHIGHKIKALRPMVYMAEPGLIDHH